MEHQVNATNVKPNIKICGLRDKETILSMDQLPVTEIGLVFAPSKRQVTVEDAKELVEAIHTINDGRTKAVGVFVRHPMEEMEQLLDELPLDIVQLHGDEDVSYFAYLRERYSQIALWKVISINAELALDREQEEKLAAELVPYVPYINALLIDAPGGGTGKPFNWEAISMYKRIAAEHQLPLFVAGGLHAGNVQQLLQAYQCDGIDVSSGVESEGKKDLHKIKEFVRKVIEA